jgi:hypothetical protein
LITSDAGALLLREAAGRLNLFDRMAQAIPDPRELSMIEHEQRTMLAQRVLGIACGWEDLNDHQSLRNDPLFRVASGRGIDPERPLAGASTLCRLENRIDRRSCVELSKLLVELFVESHTTAPTELVLDFDATDDEVHGKQVGRFFHGYYDHYCFLPLYVFCGDQLLVPYLRTADGDPARHTRAVLKLLVTRLRQAWPNVRIIVRGDSGFCRWRTMRWCDRNGIGYIFGLARNSRLETLALPWTHAAACCWEMTHEPQRLFGEFAYAAGSWDRPRRVIVKAEHGPQGDNPRFVVSNLPGNPRGLYDMLYCPRGEMENRIKEQQLMLFADRTSCEKFLANQFRVLLSAAAYVLMEAVRRLGLTGSQLERAQVSTIRLRLLKVAAQVKVSARRVYVRLAGSFPLQELFGQVLQRLTGAGGACHAVVAESG